MSEESCHRSCFRYTQLIYIYLFIERVPVNQLTEYNNLQIILKIT